MLCQTLMQTKQNLCLHDSPPICYRLSYIVFSYQNRRPHFDQTLIVFQVAFTSIWRKSYYRYSQISLERVVRPERVARPGMQTILLSE